MNQDTIGYVWTGEYDLNTLRVDGEIFESATKKLRIRKYPDTCGQGLSHFTCLFLQRKAKKCTRTNAHAQPLSCSSNILCSDDTVAVVVMEIAQYKNHR